MKKTENISIYSIIPEILRNGLRDNLNKNNDILGFILGAIDNGFSVRLNGFMPLAKYGKIEILLRWERDSDELNVVIFKGKDKQCDLKYSYDGFRWLNVELRKGRLNIEINGINQFICSTK